MRQKPINIALPDAHLREDFFAQLAPGQVMESLFDNLPGVYYFIKDRESRFMGCSNSFAEILGADSPAEMIGKTDYEYSADFLADAFYVDDKKVIESGQAMFNKIELVPSSDGSLDWLCTTKIPLHDTRNRVIGLAGTARVINDSDWVYADHPEMQKIVNFIRAHFKEKILMADTAKVGGVSISSQERLFKKTFGLTPLMYLRKTRLNAACKLLRDTNMSLAKIAVECGFNDQTNMTRAFRLELKITPLRYRRRFDEKKQKPLKSSRKSTSNLLSVANW